MNERDDVDIQLALAGIILAIVILAAFIAHEGSRVRSLQYRVTTLEQERQ